MSEPGGTLPTILLDTNVYTRLAADVEVRGLIAVSVTAGRFRVLATPKVVDELREGPLKGLPDWFPIALEAESVAVLGHARLGAARLGNGAVFTAHRGESNKIPDAIIADSADAYATMFVSDDRRARKRLMETSARCRTIPYPEFCDWLRSRAPGQ